MRLLQYNTLTTNLITTLLLKKDIMHDAIINNIRKILDELKITKLSLHHYCIEKLWSGDGVRVHGGVVFVLNVGCWRPCLV